MTEREAAAAARSRAPPDEHGSNDVVPKSTRDYSRIEYWDRRFETEEEYEWCGRFEDFRGLLVAALKGEGGGGASPAKRVLVLGSGTSRLPFDLAAEKEMLLPWLEEVVATDLSTVAVEKMAAKMLREEAEREGEEGEEERDGHGEGEEETAEKKGKRKTKSKSGNRARITWQVADMLSLPFPDASFDAVIDKGCLDALFAGFGSSGGGGENEQRFDKWRPRETAPALWDLAQRALRESHRVLRPEGGCYVQVSFEQPHFRRPFLDAPGLSWLGAETAFGEEGGLQFLFYLRRRGGEGGGALASSEAASEILFSGYKPDDSPMHDHMDSEDFLMRTSL